MSNALYPTLVKGLTYTVLKTAEWRTIVQESPNAEQLRIPQTQNPIWHFTLVYDYLYDTYYSPNNTQAYAPYTDLQTLLGFFLARQGKFDDFLFLDTTDYSASGLRSGVWQAQHAYGLGTVIIDRNGHAQLVTTAGISATQIPLFSVSGGTTPDGSIVWTDQGFFPLGWPNAPAPLPLVTDALGNFYSPIQRSVAGLFSEDVTDLVPNTLSVFAGGSPVPFSSYEILGPGLAVPGFSYMGLYLKWLVIPPSPITATFQFYFRMGFEEDTQDFERWAQGLWTIGGSNSKNGSGYLKLVSSRPPGV